VGKSNFIGFFRLIGRVLDGQLQAAVGHAGGPDAVLHFGRKISPNLRAELYFGNNGYQFQLEPTSDNRLMFSREALWWNMSGAYKPRAGHFESEIHTFQGKSNIYPYVVPTIRSWRLYHFHDTSDSAAVKQIHGINDNVFLRGDGSNLAAFLFRLKKTDLLHYTRILRSIQLIAPFFGDFHLRPTAENLEKIQLEWTEKGRDIPFTASSLSDGTLRFICLATVLQQPEALAPATILIDEPELGLHPFAVTVLGGLIKECSLNTQLIVSTQSVELVNEFDPEDLVIVDKAEASSTFVRLESNAYSEWLNDYNVGELWKKNKFGGRPS
jgi:predicted ATPase